MKFKYIKNVVTLKLNKEKCIGCRLCETVCPHRVFKIENNKAYIFDIEKCMECGACKTNCPVRAIDVDSGVGCASAIINDIFKRKSKCC